MEGTRNGNSSIKWTVSCHRHNVTPLVVLDTMATECQGNETDHLDQTLSTQNSSDESDSIGTNVQFIILIFNNTVCKYWMQM